MKWNGRLKDGEQGGTHARVINGALQVRVAAGSSVTGTDATARASAADAQASADAAQAEIDNYTDFATAEKVIGKNEIGATLYRKGIAIPAGPNTAPITYAHGITGILTVERQWGRLTRIGTNSHVPLPYPHISVTVQVSVEGADVRLDSVGNFSAFSGIYWLEYTRS